MLSPPPLFFLPQFSAHTHTDRKVSLSFSLTHSSHCVSSLPVESVCAVVECYYVLFLLLLLLLEDVNKHLPSAAMTTTYPPIKSKGSGLCLPPLLSLIGLVAAPLVFLFFLNDKRWVS